MIDSNDITAYFILIWLLGCAWQDLKKKQIYLSLIVVGFVIIFVTSLVTQPFNIVSRGAGLSLGICMLILSKLTRNQIGMGDGLIISIIGISMGFFVNSAVLIYSLILSTVFSIVLLVFFKKNSKTAFPFVPFIFLSYMGVFLS